MNDRIDFSTSDDPELPGEAAGLHSTHHTGDVLLGGHPEDAPDHVVEEFEQKSGLVGASPDGDPDVMESYESGQDDGEIT